MTPSPCVSCGTASVIRGNALALPLPDRSVDLVVTSPPYYGLRSYQDGGEHYDGQLGAELTPTEYLDGLLEATREMVRVLKPSGSIWVNLGDKYSGNTGSSGYSDKSTLSGFTNVNTKGRRMSLQGARRLVCDAPTKSLIGIPWRYALRCIDEIGLILRAEVIWSKPNGLPESVQDRVRRSHETWFHFTVQPRYFSAVDEVREEYLAPTATRTFGNVDPSRGDYGQPSARKDAADVMNPLGKLPGSVWEVPTQPLKVPAHLGVDHFAAFPMEWPRRIIRGWSPSGICVECGEGRRPVTHRKPMEWRPGPKAGGYENNTTRTVVSGTMLAAAETTIVGHACSCPESTADTRPAVVLDPFGGTGTTALVAKVLGRHGISVDMSADYCRLARWRISDPGELARAMQVEKPQKQIEGQGVLL